MNKLYWMERFKFINTTLFYKKVNTSPEFGACKRSWGKVIKYKLNMSKYLK